MTQENVLQAEENNQENQGFIAAEGQGQQAEPDLSVCALEDLTLQAQDIEDIKLENDTLIITLKDGSEVTIENFKAVMASSGITELTLADGTVVDLTSLNLQNIASDEEGEGSQDITTTSNSQETEEQAAAVNAPTEETLETVIAEGTQQDETVVDDVIENIAAIEPASGEEVDEVVVAETNQETGEVEVIEINPAAGEEENLAQLAQQLAAVEPAAGDAGTPGASSRGGYGFDSSTDAVRSTPLNAIGPINPTALQYGVNNQSDDLLFIEPLTPPLLDVNGGVDNAIVKEDGSIFIPITATLQGNDTAAQILTVTISGVDAATAATGGFLPTAVPGVYSQTLPAGTNYTGGITFTPDAQSDVDLGQFSVVATASKPSTGEIESVSDDATVITDAVADKPDVDGDDASTFVNNALDVDITGSLGADNFDGSETITGYTITSATDLSGFTFSAGTYDVGTNTLTLDPVDLAGLQVTPPTDFIGSVDLEVTIYNEETNISDTEADSSDNTNSDSDTFTLTWVKGPTITYKFSAQVDGDTGLVKEDGTLDMALDVDAGDPAGPISGDEILTVTISGVDPSWVVNLPGQSGAVWTPTGTLGEFSITLPAGESYSGVLSFTPPAQSDVDHPQITITASVFDPVLADSAGDSDSIDIVTDAVADEPTVDGDDASTFVDQPLDVDVTGGLGADADGSETITHYEITSVTDLSGFTFSAGVYDIGTNTLTIDPADLAGLQVTPPAGFVGSIDLDVTIFNEETNLSDTEVDLSDNTNSATDTFTLTWVDGPVIKYEFSNEVDGDTGLVKEDSSVTLNLSVDNVDPVGPVAGDEVLTITISDLDPTWTINLPGQSGAVWTPTGTPGEFSITLPAGESYTGAITFTPPADSDLDHPTFTISASVTDPELSLTESDSATADILTDAVIDTPTLNVFNAGGEEGTTIPLNIFAAVGETADYVSETITSITITGLPSGATLNNGSYDVGTDTWTLTLADLSGLEVTVPDGISGVFSLIVKVTSEEDVEAGDAGNGEVDFSDNIATVEQKLELRVTEDTVPTIQPAPVTVDEDNLSPISQTGDLNIDFGDDIIGATVETNDVVPTGLTSAGQTVTVTGDGATYTGVNEDGDTVFTLTLTGDGYTYEQLLPLDHAEGTATDDSLPLEFGVTVTDGDGDEVSSTITVNVLDDNPVANDDLNRFDSNAGSTSGNVVAGVNGVFDTTDADIDDQSNDEPNTVTEVNGEPVADTGTTIINGTYGFLEIDAQGNYTYTLFDGVEPSSSGETCVSLDPTAADVAGFQTSITLNGITLSIGEPRPGSSITDGGDLTWVTTDAGNGIGIIANGSGNPKVWPQGEVINIDPDQDATKIDVTVSEIGSNNAGDPLFITVNYTDGSSEEIIFNAPDPAPADGIWNVTVEGGDKEIGSIELYSEPGEDALSFLINNVKAYYPADKKLIDEFEYTLQDFDGDTDTAVLTVCAEDLINDEPDLETSDVIVDETNLDAGNLIQSGTVTADFGADGPGTITTNGVAPIGLTSGDLLVTVTSTATGYEGTTIAGTVFTLILNGDGTYTYTQILPLDHPDTTDHDDAIELEFGVVAEDEDGDQTDGTITITVKDDGPVANDDLNRFDSNAGSTSGNVITGDNGALDTTDADIDAPSEDVENTVTEVNGEPVADTGTTIINGTYGFLEIDAQGDYTYTLFDGVEPSSSGETCVSLDPTAADVEGDQTSITLNGITVSIGEPRPGSSITNGGDLKWRPQDGSGIGIGDNGSGDTKVWPRGEVLSVDPDQDATKMDITLGDIGNNNVGHPLSVDVHYADGSSETLTFNVPNPAPVDFLWTITVDGGAKKIDSVDLYNEPGDASVSFILNNVKAYYPADEKLIDEFEYTLTDADGDTSTAVLTVCAEDLINDEPDLETSDVIVDETNFDAGNLVQSGTVTADFGADGPGTISTNGVVPVGLTSAGQTVTVTGDGTTYTGVNEGGDTVFTLTLNGDGTYTYEQILPLDHPDTTDHDDAIELEFGVVAEDEDGDQTDGTITVTVKDDGPSATDVASSVYEETLRDGGVIMVTKRIPHVDFGEDGAGRVEPSRFVAKFEMGGPDVTITSAGEIVNVEADGNNFVGKVGDTVIFEVIMDPTNGLHTYKQYAPIDHPKDVADDVMWLKFYYNVIDNDGDSVEVFTTFDVVDDAPVAEDDVNCINDSGCITGNVISGVNGGPAAEDELSADISNTVVKVGDTDIPTDGSDVNIVGLYGVLTINNAGEYSYKAFKQALETKVFCLDPEPCDVDGIQESITKDGVTVAVKNSGYYDITWVNTADGSGLGIDNLKNGDSKKVWPKGETFDISFDENVSDVTLTISEIGDNNDDGNHGVDYKIYFADGSTAIGEQQFTPGEILDGTISFTIDASEYGDKLISSIDLNSTNAGQYYGASFLLNNVKATVCEPVSILEKFEYTLSDYDGDTSVATLVFKEKGGLAVEVINNGGNEVIYGDNSTSEIFLFTGNAGNDNEINDFDLNEDVLDLSAMIEEYDPTTDAIADFVSLTESGSDTIVSVDTNGAIGGANFENVVTLKDVTGLDLEDLQTDGTLVA